MNVHGQGIALTQDEAQTDWHLDKRVPIAMVVAFFIQTITLVYVGSTWKADTDQRIAHLERSNEERKSQESRLVRVEERLGYMSDSQRRIETKIDLLVNSAGAAGERQ
jgi:hypothetical protein